MIIQSDNGWFRAELRDQPAGIEVAIYRNASARQLGKRISFETLDCPLHVALDRVHDLVQSLQRELVKPLPWRAYQGAL